jgi:hypothetical protein
MRRPFSLAVLFALLAMLSGCTSGQTSAPADTYPDAATRALGPAMSGPVRTLGVAPHGEAVVAATETGSVRCQDASGAVLWEEELQFGTPIQTAVSSGGALTVVSFMSAGDAATAISTVVAFGRSGERLWRMQGPPGLAHEVKCSDDGAQVLVLLSPIASGPAGMRLLEGRTGKELMRYDAAPSFLARADTDPDLDRIVLAFADAPTPGLEAAPPGRIVYLRGGRLSWESTVSTYVDAVLLEPPYIGLVDADGGVVIRHAQARDFDDRMLAARAGPPACIGYADGLVVVATQITRQVDSDKTQIAEFKAIDTATADRRHAVLVPVGAGEDPALLIDMRDGQTRDAGRDVTAAAASADGSVMVVGTSGGQVLTVAPGR